MDFSKSLREETFWRAKKATRQVCSYGTPWSGEAWCLVRPIKHERIRD